MPDSQQVGDGGLSAALELPAAVRAACTGAAPAPAPRQLWRAHWKDVSRLVVVLRAKAATAEVAPVSVDVELATDYAVLLRSAETDFDVPVAVWLGLRAAVPVRVLEQYAGTVHLGIGALLKAPQGRPVVTPLDDRAMEVAVLGDDMDDLAAAPAADATLQELLSGVALQQLVDVGVSTQLALALSRGLRPLTPELAARVAPLIGATPEVLLRANPPLPAEVVRDLDSEPVRELVSELAARRGMPEDDARLMAGYGGYALAARETGAGSVDWAARISAYARGLLGDE